MPTLDSTNCRLTPTAPTGYRRRASLSADLLATLALALFTTTSTFALANDVIQLDGAEAIRALEQRQAQLKLTPKDAAANKEAGILLHQMTVRNPERAQAELGESYLKAALKADPADAESLAWLGSLQTTKALFETESEKQLSHIKLGARAMDQAVAKDPDNLIVRLIRGGNSVELPSFLKRTRVAIEDFTHVITLCEQRSCRSADLNDARNGLKAAKQASADDRN